MLTCQVNSAIMGRFHCTGRSSNSEGPPWTPLDPLGLSYNTDLIDKPLSLLTYVLQSKSKFSDVGKRLVDKTFLNLKLRDWRKVLFTNLLPTSLNFKRTLTYISGWNIKSWSFVTNFDPHTKKKKLHNWTNSDMYHR